MTPAEQQRRKEHVLTRGTPSVTRSVAAAVVIKDENLFFLCQPDGSVPLSGAHGFGLYYHDCRYLNGYEVRLLGIEPSVLVAEASRGFMAVLQLTNPDVLTENDQHVARETIGGRLERVLDIAALTLHDHFTFHNFGLERIAFPFSLSFRAGFEDVFAIRGMLTEKLGQLRPPTWQDGALCFGYDGADGLLRRLTISFSPQPQATNGPTARFSLGLDPGESCEVVVSMQIAEQPQAEDVAAASTGPRPNLPSIQTVVQRATEEWVAQRTRLTSNSILLNETVERSFRDLHMLRNRLGDDRFFAAGVPWFVTLFGRDSLITALQTLAYDPTIAEETLRLLASLQGTKVDGWRDEEPGKILHELRVGEMTRTGEIPHDPYYGTVDATLLFLILVGQHAAWTGTLKLFDDLRDNVERAIAWMERASAALGDGYISYHSSSTQGLINQGWKDSGDAIVNDDGSLASPPIGLVEVQGYAYLARTCLAELFERAGEATRAARLRQEAAQLRDRFNRDFWLADKGFYALALQQHHAPCAVLSSNAGQALWTGIADADKARLTVQRLMADDMFSGWGVRTLSTQERRYNPIGYHLGTVWPHDNSIMAAGFRRYGFDDAARRIFNGVLEAAMRFEHYRLPELFSGFPRSAYRVPVRYPVACHPQAWAAGTIPFLLQTLLGLAPAAFEQRLRIIRPMLPDVVDRLELHRLRVGSAELDLRFERTPDQAVAVEVLCVRGNLDVIVEPRALRRQGQTQQTENGW